jgi:hypothetical protein
VLWVIVYEEYWNKTRALLAVLYLKDYMLDYVNITRLVSFGTLNLHVHDYGIAGAVIDRPNYSFDLWDVLAEVAMVSDT